MNTLITGANGLLGRHLVELLSQKNKVYAILRDKNQLKFTANKNVILIEADLANFDKNILPTNIDVIYYLAQSRRFREFPEGSEDVLTINVVTPVKMANWAIENKIKIFIYTSSGGVYTNPKQPVKEFFEINANERLGFYLNSKLSAEMLIRNYGRLFDTFVIVRPFFIYGPGQIKTMLIPRLIRNVIEGKEIILSGKDGIRINPIYVQDAAQSMANILRLKGEHTINIAGKEIVTLKELSFLIGTLVGKTPIFKFEEQKQYDLVADNTLMKTLLHEPKVSLQEGLLKLILHDYNTE